MRYIRYNLFCPLIGVHFNWCGWVQEGANDNMMRKKHKITVLVISWQGFQIYMNCRTQPRMQDTCTI